MLNLKRLCFFVCTDTLGLFQIEIKPEDGICPTPNEMAGQVVSYLEGKGYLEAQ